MEQEDLLNDLFELLNPKNNAYQEHRKYQPNFEDEQIMSKLKAIKEHFKQTYQQATIVQEKIEKKKFQFSMPLEIHGSMCRTILVVQIDFECHTFKIHIQFAEQYGRMQVKQKMLRLQLGRYMLRLNNNLRVGSFYINPQYGYIGLNLTCLSDENFRRHLISEETYNLYLFPYLDSLIYTALHSMKFHFMRILFLTNRIKIKDFPLYEEYMEKQKKILQWRKLPKEAEELLSRIKLIVKRNMHLQFTDEQYKVYGMLLAKSVSTDQKCLVEIAPSEQRELENLQSKINEGGFCNIYSKDLYYSVYKDGSLSNAAQQKRTLVIKKEKDSNGGRVERERQILLTLAANNNQMNSLGDQFIKKNGCCPYIAQFYFVKDKRDTLLMERYFHASLDYFKVKQQEVISLSTKIYIAHSIAMGLRYCHSYGIVHMDIKPANILVSKTLMAKITDFGEAINIYDKGNAKSGKTFPYAAPEMTQGKQITTAYDIFAFGTMLFELIFDRYPIDFKKTNNKNLEERFFKNNYYVRYDEEYAQTMGPQVIVKYLGRMCIQCLQPEPQNRPNIDKICLVLKDCLTYLDKVY